MICQSASRNSLIADLVASRYGKSQTLAVAVSLLAMVQAYCPISPCNSKALVLGFNCSAANAAASVELGEAGQRRMTRALIVPAVLALFPFFFRHYASLDATDTTAHDCWRLLLESLVKAYAWRFWR